MNKKDEQLKTELTRVSEINLKLLSIVKELELEKKKNQLLELENYEKKNIEEELEEQKLRCDDLEKKLNMSDKNLQKKLEQFQTQARDKFQKLEKRHENEVNQYTWELESTYNTMNALDEEHCNITYYFYKVFSK